MTTIIDLWAGGVFVGLCDWVGGTDKEVSDAILLWEGLILATLGMDKGKCGYVGCISGWFWALRVAP